MADVQLENGYIRIATELIDEVIRRDFSKRQLAILHFIIRLSYGCQKKDCIIDKFNSFELAGLNKSDIKKELKFLRDCRVINWDDGDMIFSINKDYEKWQINPSKGFDKEKLDQLIHENLKIKVGKIPTNQKSEVGKTPTSELVKHQLEESSNHCESKAEQTSKDSIKDSSLKINTITTNKNSSDSVDLIAERFTNLKTMQTGRTSYPVVEDYQEIAQIVAQGVPLSQTIEFLEQCFKEYAERNPNGKISRFKYCAKYILDHYKAFLAKEDAKETAKNGVPIQEPNAYKPYYGKRKPIRKELLPDWFDENQQKKSETTAITPVNLDEKKKAIEDKIAAFRSRKTI